MWSMIGVSLPLFRRGITLPTVSCLLLLLASCGGKTAAPPAATEPAKEQASTTPVSAADNVPATPAGMSLPLSFGRRTGDLDEMAKSRNIRALVILNPIGFFYDKGHPQGIMYEGLQEFQKFVNQKLKTGTLNITVTFIPMRPDQIEAALTEGVGDMIAYGLVITPEREKRVAFSVPLQTNVSQIVVTGADFGPVSSIAD